MEQNSECFNAIERIIRNCRKQRRHEKFQERRQPVLPLQLESLLLRAVIYETSSKQEMWSAVSHALQQSTPSDLGHAQQQHLSSDLSTLLQNAPDCQLQLDYRPNPHGDRETCLLLAGYSKYFRPELVAGWLEFMNTEERERVYRAMDQRAELEEAVYGYLPSQLSRRRWAAAAILELLRSKRTRGAKALLKRGLAVTLEGMFQGSHQFGKVYYQIAAELALKLPESGQANGLLEAAFSEELWLVTECDPLDLMKVVAGILGELPCLIRRLVPACQSLEKCLVRKLRGREVEQLRPLLRFLSQVAECCCREQRHYEFDRSSLELAWLSPVEKQLLEPYYSILHRQLENSR